MSKDRCTNSPPGAPRRTVIAAVANSSTSSVPSSNSSLTLLGGSPDESGNTGTFAAACFAQLSGSRREIAHPAGTPEETVEPDSASASTSLLHGKSSTGASPKNIAGNKIALPSAPDLNAHLVAAATPSAVSPILQADTNRKLSPSLDSGTNIGSPGTTNPAELSGDAI